MTPRLTISRVALVAALAAAPAAAQDLPQADNEWFQAAQETLERVQAVQPITTPARNVIIMIADGNGVGTNYATRLFDGQENAGNMGDEHVLHHETFPHLGLVKTYNVNAQTPDSAGTGTAMHGGVKTKAGVIGVDASLDRGDCSQVEDARVALAGEIFTDMGKSVGIVSTARITHATPASVYAHSADRNFENDGDLPEGCEVPDIATQLIDAMEAGTIDVAMGGGRRNFYPEGAEVPEGGEGRRVEGDLVERAEGLGAQVAFDTETFGGVDTASTPILGLFEDSHMQYEYDRSGEPSLAEMTAAAIEALSANEEGFFLSVEAGRVDHANHAGNLHRVVTDGIAFAEAVAMADEMTDDADTLIVVTADHEHAIAFNGYCGRGSPITGLCYEIDEAGTMHAESPNLGDDEKPYTVVGYLNGPGSVLLSDQGYSGERAEVTAEEATDPEYLQQALIPMSSETHSGEDVAVYAKGPFAHLLNGTVEQNYIFHVMHHAATAEGEVAQGAGEQPTAEDVLPVAEEAREDLDESMVDEGAESD